MSGDLRGSLGGGLASPDPRPKKRQSHQVSWGLGRGARDRREWVISFVHHFTLDRVLSHGQFY